MPSQQCSPLLWFGRTSDTHNVYCMDGHLLNIDIQFFFTCIHTVVQKFGISKILNAFLKKFLMRIKDGSI